MKCLHISDTHLGFSAYRRVSDEGINQREKDCYEAFQKVIDYAIQTKPDFILHSGDLFDSVRPNNRAISVAITQILRLEAEKIPVIILSGNHEQPKLRETGHIFSIFDHLDYVYPVYNEVYEKIDLMIDNEKISIHAIPQTRTTEEFDNQLRCLHPDSKASYNILMAHGCVQGIKAFSMNEFNELFIPKHLLDSTSFQYVALGHYHSFKQVSNHAYYAGATESLTFTDAGEKKGFIEVQLSEHDVQSTFLPLETRVLIDTKPIDCSQLDIEEIMKKIIETIDQIEPKNKIFRINLSNILIQQYRSIDFQKIRLKSEQAIHYEIRPQLLNDISHVTKDEVKIGELSKEFQQFMESQELKEKVQLMELGRYYLEKMVSEKEKE